MKILYIINKLSSGSGGAVINNRNLALLQNVYGKENVIVYEFAKTNFNNGSFYSKILSLFGEISIKILGEIYSIIKEEDVKAVFIANSIYGLVAKGIKKKFKKLIVVTFFHNVEYLYIKDLFKASKLKSRYFLPFFIKRVERRSVDYSDLIIALNERDSEKLLSIYGRNADFLLPTSMESQEIVVTALNEKFISKANKLELLFVGSNFYANVHGINWFINNVMTRVENVNLSIVGNGLDDKIIVGNKNVIVYGRVESLEEFYEKAQIVILPIFLGSGMKTKTAEALMYGKPILATSEALEGYIIKNINEIGSKCNTDKEFIEQINYFNDHRLELFDKGINSRNFFLENYSNEAIRNLFERTIDVRLKELMKVKYV
ncbi:glycosyltransferase [Flavobacterium sp.]|uniref:glycosyltransferase n=1 Tax=Flavobacterium sp. TaxID=239 RepID=UPI0031CF9DAE